MGAPGPLHVLLRAFKLISTVRVRWVIAKRHRRFSFLSFGGLNIPRHSGHINTRQSKKLSALLFFQFIYTKVRVEQVPHFSI
jgi:hypothetical protein